MEDIKETVSRTKVDRQVGKPLKFILDVTEILRFPQAVHGQGARKAGCADFIRSECIGGRKRNCAAGASALVHLNAADFDSRFYGVAAVYPRHIVDSSERITGTDAQTIVI